jgi:hypothetical protein
MVAEGDAMPVTLTQRPYRQIEFDGSGTGERRESPLTDRRADRFRRASDSYLDTIFVRPAPCLEGRRERMNTRP